MKEKESNKAPHLQPWRTRSWGSHSWQCLANSIHFQKKGKEKKYVWCVKGGNSRK